MVSARTVCGPSLASRIVTPACYGGATATWLQGAAGTMTGT